jgi:hypothetical protein
MAEELDTTTLSNEESGDLFDALLSGELNLEAADEVNEEETVTETNEDTDQEEEVEEETETNEPNDGEVEDTGESDTDDEEENTPVDEDSSEDADDDEDAPVVDITDEATPATEDNTDTEVVTDGKDAKTTDAIDYKKFYEEVTGTEIMINGRKAKGFSDPKKILQAQQKAGGFDGKMSKLKKFRPFMAPLEERGLLKDPEKFNFAMSLIDGDKEALKKFMKDQEIDPLELDLETINYSGENTLTSNAQLVIEDTLSQAKSLGVDDKVAQVLTNDWDEQSFNEFVENPNVRNDLIQHLQDGSYNTVMDKISEINRVDVSGAFDELPKVEQYRIAVEELNKDYQNSAQAQEAQARAAYERQRQAQVEAEKAKILQRRKEEEYRAKAAETERKVAENRKRAASISKKNVKSQPKKTPSIMDLEGDDLDALYKQLIMGK